MDVTNMIPPAAMQAGQAAIFTKERLQELTATLNKYKQGKATLEKRIIGAEQVWKLRHWEQIRANVKDTADPEPTSGWLVNAILSKHSDAMDAYPQPICLAREEGDRVEAKTLSSVLPVVMEQNDFEQTWSDVWWYKLKAGTGVYGVFWDSNKLGGLGDISIRKVDVLNLFWEPGIADIQQSKYVFHVELVDKDSLTAAHPELKGHLDGGLTVSKYIYDESVSTADKAAVVDCYYKVREGARDILHYVKYVGESVLFSSEGDPRYADGFYHHGKYPFVMDALFPEEGYPNCGFGYVDLCQDPQKFIDLMNNAFIKNTLVSSTPRWFIRSDGGVNEAEYADMTKSFVHVQGRVDEDSVRQIVQQPLSDVYVSLMQLKIDELKQTSGNRDVNNGSTTSGVTAASAIAALQEAGNGLSRDMISASYRAYRDVCLLCIELIRQFYDAPRTFRIVGEAGMEQFVSFSNAGLTQQALPPMAGMAEAYRLPVFDIEVEVQKESSYTIATYNELAVQLYQMGCFNPQAAEQTLMMLDMMEFKGKDALVNKIRQNAMIYQQMMNYMQLALTLAMKYEPGMVQGLSANITGMMGGGGMPSGGLGGGMSGIASMSGDPTTGAPPRKEHPNVQKARQREQDSKTPR